MTVYYGYSASGDLLEILKVGNKVRIVGVVSKYEAAGTYQVSGLTYDIMRPTHADNTQLIESGHSGAYELVSASDFANKQITIEKEDAEGNVVSKDYKLAELKLNSSIAMNNLTVEKTYTTTNEQSSSQGAMTLTCTVDGIEIQVRTIVLKDEEGNIITADTYKGKTINVKGMVEYYDADTNDEEPGEYQIKIFSAKDITIVG